ncbi:hypothetical protein FDI21_gp280 [Pseudomonas phage Noxifer]|uniref:Uncharacterized protein n=1 Tax=Pseudomonas phage Noxifer TaxID=2006684 RepID=A0A1Y0SV83_9CAUD|nr:hypothetical protein FDI21_gp280 [Pseudomonas phage Noxifer]ARV77431.1 hypothetical protein NOXIFER_266 [Pseudomonas phage Noxifer]
MKLEELLAKGIRTQDSGQFLRSAGMGIGEDTFEILRAYALYSRCERMVWVAGSLIRTRLLNREYLGTPKEFKRTQNTDPRIFGQIRYADVYCFGDSKLYNKDTLIAVTLDKEDNVIEYCGVRIDTDREESCRMKSATK